MPQPEFITIGTGADTRRIATIAERGRDGAGVMWRR
jgi:hypothetical protein